VQILLALAGRNPAAFDRSQLEPADHSLVAFDQTQKDPCKGNPSAAVVTGHPLRLLDYMLGS
ncbi:hypothetical protein, partial [Neobacillus drentensis]|uniref:hypothetical protein n=1 Tax=Neobacillus drentensis TaxID=220684 RepID=UPI002FFE4B89